MRQRCPLLIMWMITFLWASVVIQTQAGITVRHCCSVWIIEVCGRSTKYVSSDKCTLWRVKEITLRDVWSVRVKCEPSSVKCKLWSLKSLKFEKLMCLCDQCNLRVKSESNKTKAILVAFALSLSLDPTFWAHFHKTLDTAQSSYLLKPNWELLF